MKLCSKECATQLENAVMDAENGMLAPKEAESVMLICRPEPSDPSLCVVCRHMVMVKCRKRYVLDRSFARSELRHLNCRGRVSQSKSCRGRRMRFVRRSRLDCTDPQRIPKRWMDFVASTWTASPLLDQELSNSRKQPGHVVGPKDECALVGSTPGPPPMRSIPSFL